MPMAALPLNLTVFQVVRRLRCRSCGGRVLSVAIDNAEAASRHQRRKVWGGRAASVKVGHVHS